ncbi:MAG: NUDIX domain-containing protein [Anaerolineae bacterium]|nr:NUDIX domain-containing protein [Anaerolineae bacterium]
MRLKLYCEACGALLVEQVMDGRARQVCPACGSVVYGCLKVGAGVLVERDGRLLLVRRGPEADAFPGTWCLPAGYCEPDEPPTVTAVREAREETGLELHISCVKGAYYFQDDPRGNGVLLVYEAHAEEGEVRCDGVEVVDARFFAAGELPERLCGGGHDQAIQAWAARAIERWNPGDPLRFCPHCTCELKEQEAYGRVRPVCPTCGYVHFTAPKVGVSVLAERNGQALLIQRAIEPGLGKWSLPSGFVEWDEAPEVAAMREVAEETGLDVENLVLLSVDHYTEDYRGPGLNINYRGLVRGGDLRAADDAARVRFFSPGGLPALDEIAFGSHRQVLADWAGSREG